MRTDIFAILTPLVLLLNACSIIPPLPSADARVKRCLAMHQQAAARIAEAGTGLSRPAKIAGFPYLRVNRFLASYRDQNMDQATLAAWLERMAQYNLAARSIELARLPAVDYSALTEAFRGDPQRRLTECSNILLHYDLMHSERVAALRSNAVVPTEYLTLNQILGLYPFSAIPISIGVHNYHRETHETFAQPLQALTINGELRRFTPPPQIPSATDAAAPARHDALGIPAPTAQQLEALFARHAPVWEIDVAGRHDLPGSPVWHADGTPDVDTSEPVVYRYPSYTHWQGAALLQLNYVIWFSERPRIGSFDILAGALDGLIWRVTLKSDGNVLIYDTIHPCGCYHYFFPGPALTLQQQALTLPEPPLVPQSAPALQAQQRLVIRIASATHYIQRIYTDDDITGTSYSWRDYSDLYSIPVSGDGNRSLFAANGLVPASERSERWLLWPMGVPSAGAMRERGRHATAFIGRRHFDDADLLDRLFEPVQIYSYPHQ